MHLIDNTFLQGGKYRIIRFISSGGFGCTYEAEHVMLEKRVAIKEFFVKDFCNRDEKTAYVTVAAQNKSGLVQKLRHKFLDEAKALARLQHLGIVRVSDVFEENGTAYFVMDYIEGESLNDKINKNGPLSESQALHYIFQVAEALAYVHEHNRLHLDIKPGNIMIDNNENAILIDFGASKQYDEEDGENTSTLMGKTLGYAPLEQMSNDVVQFMPATDIYALGATLYKMLTGITPLSANLLACDEDLEPLPTSISNATRNAVEAAMTLSKKRRTQSIQEFLSYWNKTTLQLERKDNNQVGHTIMPALEKAPEYIEIKASVFADSQESTDNAASLSSQHIKELQNSEETLIVNESSCLMLNQEECVDLGLSVKWRNRNLGSEKSSDYGDLFAWFNNRIDIRSANDTIVWGELADDIAGASCDIATLELGEQWKMPTRSQWKELIDKCEWTWTNFDGVMGYHVIGRNGNSIFLPAAGKRNSKVHYYANEKGYYWASTKSKVDQNSDFLLFDKSDYDLYYEPFSILRSIRPVCE